MSKYGLGTRMFGLLVLLATGCAAEEGDADQASEEPDELGYKISETMTDRCSADVVFPGKYNQGPLQGVMGLQRRADGTTDWTPAFKVELDGSGRIRWWCHSTKGNAFDVGTWRIDSLGVAVNCSNYADGEIEGCKPDGDISIGSSAQNGWTAERSRCDDHSTRIRARLGRDRLLQIQCLGK